MTASRELQRKTYDDLTTAMSFQGANVGMCINGRIFAVLEQAGLAVRVGAVAVRAHAEAGQGEPFDQPGFDWGEWLLSDEASTWTELANEAMKYVGSIRDPRFA